MNFIVLIEEFNNYDTGEERFIVKKVIEYKTEIYETEDDNIDGYVVPSGWKLRDSELIEEKNVLSEYECLYTSSDLDNYISGSLTLTNSSSLNGKNIIIPTDDTTKYIRNNNATDILYQLIKSISGYKVGKYADVVSFTPSCLKTTKQPDELTISEAANNYNDIYIKTYPKVNRYFITSNMLYNQYKIKSSNVRILRINDFDTLEFIVKDKIKPTFKFKLTDFKYKKTNIISKDSDYSYLEYIDENNNKKKSNIMGVGFNWSNIFQKKFNTNPFFNIYYIYECGIVLEYEIIGHYNWYGFGWTPTYSTIGFIIRCNSESNYNPMFEDVQFTNSSNDGKLPLSFCVPRFDSIRPNYDSSGRIIPTQSNRYEGCLIPINERNVIKSKTSQIDIAELQLQRYLYDHKPYGAPSSIDDSEFGSIFNPRYLIFKVPSTELNAKFKDLGYSYIGTCDEFISSNYGSANNKFIFSNTVNLNTALSKILSLQSGFNVFDCVYGLRVWKIDDVYNKFKNTLSKESFKKVSY